MEDANSNLIVLGLVVIRIQGQNPGQDQGLLQGGAHLEDRQHHQQHFCELIMFTIKDPRNLKDLYVFAWLHLKHITIYSQDHQNHLLNKI